MTINSKAWIIWTLAGATIAMLARNPLYALTVLFVVYLVRATLQEDSMLVSYPFLRMAIIIIVMSTLYNALFVHAGMTTIFMFPNWPLIGGPITLEAAAEGASNGLTLLALIGVFVVLNAAVRSSELTRLIPPALRDVGVVILIAFTYIPETRRQFQNIREAQAIRGHQIKGFRDWQPIVIPLLVGGLERSLRLAESMVARGYGATSDRPTDRLEQVALIASLVMALLGWLLVIWLGRPGWILIWAGLGVLLVTVWRRNRRAKRSTLRPTVWTWLDVTTVVVAISALLVIVLPLVMDIGIDYAWVPYPKIFFPDYNIFAGLMIFIMALPPLITSFKAYTINHDHPT